MYVRVREDGFIRFFLFTDHILTGKGAITIHSIKRARKGYCTPVSTAVPVRHDPKSKKRTSPPPGALKDVLLDLVSLFYKVSANISYIFINNIILFNPIYIHVRHPPLHTPPFLNTAGTTTLSSANMCVCVYTRTQSVDLPRARAAYDIHDRGYINHLLDQGIICKKRTKKQRREPNDRGSRECTEPWGY